MKENSPITLVTHELDGAWQFMGDEPVIDFTKMAMLVGLGEIIEHDKSVLDVANMPKGYQATPENQQGQMEDC